MRVLHLAAVPSFTGAAEPAFDLARGLRALGVDVELFADNRRVGNFRGILDAHGFRANPKLVLSTKAGPLAWLGDFLELRRSFIDFEVVHTHLSHDHGLAALASRCVGRSSSSRSPFAASEPKSAPSQRRHRPLIVRTIHAARGLDPSFGRRLLLQRGADGLVVASHDEVRFLEEALKEAHGRDSARGGDDGHRLSRPRGDSDGRRVDIYPERVLVLPGAVDAQRFHPDPDARGRVRRSLAISKTDFAIGCVARFQAGRRHELMIEALAQARVNHPEIKLVLIGHGERESALRALAEQAAPLGAIVFAGYHREDLNDYLAAMDAAVWLVPGNDATSRAVLQAMAVALPVVGGRRGAIAEAVLEGETGVLVDPDAAEDIARGFTQLAELPDRGRCWGGAGRARVLTAYDLSSRAQQLLVFYERLIRVASTAP
ncbi:MAG: glycosyltransferase family 4 protein [Deltaproteobacteria bacterium]|nr:glycosyltransferase family 4 protein [Deltaproteobacteria bacterium]